MILFYTNPMSRGQIVRWMLHEVGAHYEQRLLDYGTTMKDADYRAINPMGKVPAIVHDGAIVTETAAICAYLADAFPAAQLGPNSEERAAYFRWFFFAAGPLEAAVTNHAAKFSPTPEQAAMFGYGSFDATIDALDSWLSSHAYGAGERFTALDVYLGSQVIWGTQFGTMPQRASFVRYAANLMERPAYRAAKAVDAELIAQAKAVHPS